MFKEVAVPLPLKENNSDEFLKQCFPKPKELVDCTRQEVDWLPIEEALRLAFLNSNIYPQEEADFLYNCHLRYVHQNDTNCVKLASEITSPIFKDLFYKVYQATEGLNQFISLTNKLEKVLLSDKNPSYSDTLKIMGEFFSLDLSSYNHKFPSHILKFSWGVAGIVDIDRRWIVGVHDVGLISPEKILKFDGQIYDYKKFPKHDDGHIGKSIGEFSFPEDPTRLVRRKVKEIYNRLRFEEEILKHTPFERSILEAIFFDLTHEKSINPFYMLERHLDKGGEKKFLKSINKLKFNYNERSRNATLDKKTAFLRNVKWLQEDFGTKKVLTPNKDDIQRMRKEFWKITFNIVFD